MNIYHLNRDVLVHLEHILLCELSKEGNSCPCCQSKYGGIRIGCDVAIEFPIRTACGHLFGEDCLTKWLPNNNSCPLCRAPLLDPLILRLLTETENEEVEEGNELRLDDSGDLLVPLDGYTEGSGRRPRR